MSSNKLFNISNGNMLHCSINLFSESMERMDGLDNDILPRWQVQASLFSLQISYFLQKCKKGKPRKKDLPLMISENTNFLESQKLLIYCRYEKLCKKKQNRTTLPIILIRRLINSKASALLSLVFLFHF